MLQNLQSISLKSEFLRNNKNSPNLGCFLEHFFESFLKKYLFSYTENSNQYKSRVPLPQIDVAETNQAYYFQIELPEVQQQNVEKEINKSLNNNDKKKKYKENEKGTIVITFSNYYVNTGLSDDIFKEDQYIFTSLSRITPNLFWIS